MKLALLTLVVAMTSLSANAQRGRDRDIIFDRGPIGGGTVTSCSYHLEKEEYNWRRNMYVYKQVETMTEYGRFACEDAKDACEEEKSDMFPPWQYRCVKGMETRAPRPVQSCDFRIETRFGFERETYSGFGRRACVRAENECLDDLARKQSLPRWDNDWVGPRARCVKTSRDTDPRPRPPRMVSASCTAEMMAGRVGRPTGNRYTESASARNYQEARQRACDQALNACRSQTRGTLFCEVVD